MKTDIDYLINLMKKYTKDSTETLGSEIDEQEEASSGGGGTTTTGGGNTNSRGRKWETGITRGKANKLGLKGEKWESGLARGKANPVP
jgi:hypothetical protein